MGFPNYPAALTYKNWDKKKSKLTPTTGLGKELKKLEKEFENVPTKTVRKLEDATSPSEIKDAADAVKAAFPKIEAYRKVLFTFSKTADKVAKDIGKKKTFPKASLKLITEMSTAASQFATAIRDYPDALHKKATADAKDYDKRLAKKIDDTKTTHAALKKHHSNAEKVKTDILETVEKAKDLMDGNQVDSGKKLLANGAKELKKLDKLVKACETDSKAWRTAKSDLSGEDMKELAPLATEIMKSNKAVVAAKKDAEDAIKQVLKAFAAAAS